MESSPSMDVERYDPSSPPSGVLSSSCIPITSFLQHHHRHRHEQTTTHSHHHLLDFQFMEAQRKQLSSQDEQLKEQWIHQQKEKERLLQVQQERLESLKKKEKHEQSAIASSEVKQRLQEFVLLKKQREAAAAAAKAANHGSPVVNHSGCSSGASSGGSSHNGSGGPGSPSSVTSYGVIQPHSVLPHHVHSMYPASHPLHPLHQHLQQQILGQHRHPHPVHQSSLSSSSATKMEPLYSSPSMPNICLGRTSNSPSRVSVSISVK